VESYVALQSKVAPAGGVNALGRKLLGEYEKLPVTRVGKAGIPGDASSQFMPSVGPDPVHDAPQGTSLLPATLTHLPPPPAHCESLVQKQR
jgi:hypothetical protein